MYWPLKNPDFTSYFLTMTLLLYTLYKIVDKVDKVLKFSR